MKTLWERLSEENKQKIKLNSTLYPTIIRDLIDELKNTYSYTDLKFESVIFLVQELTKDDKGWVVLIDDLFKNEKI
jgi:hypothetical protein